MAKKTTKKDTKTASKAKTTAKSTKSKATAKTASKASTKATSTKKQTVSKPKTQETKAAPTTKKSKPNYKLISIIVLVGLLVAFLFVIRNQFIVASVNGSPISRYALIKELEKQGGKQVLEGLVVQKIIDQEANKKGVKVTDQDIDSEIDQLRGQIPQGMTLEQMLELQGGDIQSLRQQLVLQIKLRKILEDQVSVTNEEVNEAYESQKEQFGDTDEKQAKDQLRESLQQQKLSSQINTWIQQKQQEADVKYYMFVVKPQPTPEDQQPQVQEQPEQEVELDQPTESPEAE